MSVLERREQELTLNLGMATKPSAELQDPSTMRVVENLHWRGAGEIEKVAADDVTHYLDAPVGSVYPTADACGLVLRENDPVLVTGSHGVMTYSNGQPQWARRLVGVEWDPTTDGGLRYAPVSYGVSRRFVDRSQNSKEQLGVFQVASAQHQGVHVIAWLCPSVSPTNTLLMLRAIDADTGSVVATLEAVSLVGGDVSHVSACEYTEVGKEGVLIAYANTGVPSVNPYTIKTVRYAHALRQFVMDADLTTNGGGSSGIVRFVVRRNGARFYLAFNHSATGFLTVQDRTIATVTATHTGTHTAVRGVDVLRGQSRTLIVSSTGAALFAEVFGAPASALTLATAAGELFYGCTAALETRSGTAEDAVVWVNGLTSVSGEPDSSRVIAMEVNFSATTPTTSGYQTVAPHAWCASLGFTLRGRAHVAMALGFYGLVTNTTRTPITCVVARYAGHYDFSRHDPVAKLCHGRFFLRANAENLAIFSSTYTDDNDNAWIALPADPAATPTDYGGVTAVLPQTVFLARVDAKRPMPMPYAAPEPGVVLVAGGCPWQFDGDTPAEAAPLMRPIVELDVSAGTGVSGSYGVVAMWKWIDAAGRLHRIASLPVLTGAISNKQIDVYVSRCPLAAYDSLTAPGMDMEVYITGNTAAGGSATYQLATTALGGKQSATGVTSNRLWYKFAAVNPANNNGVTDAIFTSEIAPEPTPAFFHIAKVVDRMLAIDAEDRGRIWFSKPIVAGFGVEWATSCTFTIGDECTGVVDAQGGIVVLARGGTYLVSGAGPDATVASLATSPFSPAVKLSNEVDCIDPVSVCRTPVGAVFRGRRGFYVLSGTQAQPFGAPIDPEVLTDPAIDPSSAFMYRMRTVWQEQTNEIHLLAPTARYIFNLLEQKWSRRVIFDRTTLDMVVARGKLWRHDQSLNGDILVSEFLYSEFGTGYNTGAETEWMVETPWIKPDDVGGQCRVWRAWWSLAVPPLPANELGDFLRLTFYSDYSLTVQQQVWTYSEIAALRSAGDRVVELPFCPARQACKSFKFRLETVGGAAVALKPLSLRLRLGVRPSKTKHVRSEPKG